LAKPINGSVIMTRNTFGTPNIRQNGTVLELHIAFATFATLIFPLPPYQLRFSWFVCFATTDLRALVDAIGTRIRANQGHIFIANLYQTTPPHSRVLAA